MRFLIATEMPEAAHLSMKLAQVVLLSSCSMFAAVGCITTVVPSDPGPSPSPTSTGAPEAGEVTPEESAEEPIDAGPKPKDAGKGKDTSSGPPRPPAPPASFTGIGSSFAACNGRGRVAHYGPTTPTKIIDVPTAWIFGTDAVSGRGNKVFGYSPSSSIERATFPLTGTVGGYQVKVAINSAQATLVAGRQYGGTLALSTWNASTNAWDQAVGSSTAVVVSILDFTSDATAWSDGRWCAGRLVARVESIVDGTGVDRLDFEFYAPLLTPSFPK